MLIKMKKAQAWIWILVAIAVVAIIGVMIYLVLQPEDEQNNQNNNNNNNLDNECFVDNDCVPATCCHPVSCVSLNEMPDCSAISCTAECSGPLDCGEGECRCINNQCQVFDLMPTTQQETYNIEIRDFSYNPDSLTIREGDRVIWTNYDSVGHTVTSDSGNELDSQLLSAQETYIHTFNSAGSFAYHCTPHPNMRGEVIVE